MNNGTSEHLELFRGAAVYSFNIIVSDMQKNYLSVA